MDNAKQLNLESVNEVARHVSQFIQHIPNSELHYVSLPAEVDEVTLSYLKSEMLKQLDDRLSPMVEDWIEYQKENDDIEVTDDTVVMSTGDTKTVLHFSIVNK